jgi:hypothetical protein
VLVVYTPVTPVSNIAIRMRIQIVPKDLEAITKVPLVVVILEEEEMMALGSTF